MFKDPVHASVICDTSVHFLGMQAHRHESHTSCRPEIDHLLRLSVVMNELMSSKPWHTVHEVLLLVLHRNVKQSFDSLYRPSISLIFGFTWHINKTEPFKM